MRTASSSPTARLPEQTTIDDVLSAVRERDFATARRTLVGIMAGTPEGNFQRQLLAAEDAIPEMPADRRAGLERREFALLAAQSTDPRIHQLGLELQQSLFQPFTAELRKAA